MGGGPHGGSFWEKGWKEIWSSLRVGQVSSTELVSSLMPVIWVHFPGLPSLTYTPKPPWLHLMMGLALLQLLSPVLVLGSSWYCSELIPGSILRDL